MTRMVMWVLRNRTMAGRQALKCRLRASNQRRIAVQTRERDRCECLRLLQIHSRRRSG